MANADANQTLGPAALDWAAPRGHARVGVGWGKLVGVAEFGGSSQIFIRDLI